MNSAPPSKTSLLNLISLLLTFTIILIIYLPLILHGGFIADDWGIIYNAKIHQSFTKIFFFWLSHNASHRPVYALLLGFFSSIFKTNATLYLLTNILVWIIGNILIGKLLTKILDSRTNGQIYLFLSFLPIITSTNIFSSATMIAATWALLFWAISVLLLEKYLSSSLKIYLITSTGFSLLGLLTYEAILPLLILNITLPLYNSTSNSKRLNLHKTNKSILLLTSINFLLLITLSFIQLVVSRIYTSTITSRFSIENFTKITLSILSYFYSILIDLPLMLINSAMLPPKLASIALTILIIIYILIYKYLNKNKKVKIPIYFIPSIILALLATSLLFILSNYFASISGYANRIMLAPNILIAILLSVLISRSMQSKNTLIFFIIIYYLFAQAFLYQRDNIIQSAKFQNIIIRSFDQKISSMGYPQQDFIVIANIPAFLNNNFNDEPVFASSWDFFSSVKLFNAERYAHLKAANVINQDKINNNKIIFSPNKIVIDRYWQAQLDDNILFYEYNSLNGQARLIEINSIEQLAAIIKDMSARNINLINRPLLAQFRIWLIARFKNQLGK